MEALYVSGPQAAVLYLDYILISLIAAVLIASRIDHERKPEPVWTDLDGLLRAGSSSESSASGPSAS